MSKLFPGTDPKSIQILVEGYRRMSPSEKLKRVIEMTNMTRALALTDIRRRHPDADARECDLRLASRMIPADLMRKAFGWDPDREGY